MTDLSPAERADRAREADALAEATLTLEQRGELADVLTNLRAGRDGHRQALTYYRRWSEVEADALAPVVARMVAEAADAREAEVRAAWVGRLAALCDDDWLRRRDRAMELPGVKGHRWERRGASAWERAAHDVRAVLNDLADYEEEWVSRHDAYLAWLSGGRDVGQERAALAPADNDGEAGR